MAIMAYSIGDELRSRLQRAGNLSKAARETNIEMGRGDEVTMLLEKREEAAGLLGAQGRSMASVSYDSLILNEENGEDW